MLYYLFDYLDNEFQLSGAKLFRFLTFRSGASTITSLFIALFIGRRIIEFLKKKQMKEIVRDLGLKGEIKKKETPTMGGVIIIISTLIPVFLFSKLDNIYIILLIFSMIWMGTIGFIDDYLKNIKKNKDGLKGGLKIISQIFLGVFISIIIYFHPKITIKQEQMYKNNVILFNVDKKNSKEKKSAITSVPFMKNNVFSYSDILFFLDKKSSIKYAWISFILVVSFIVISVSNGANLADGIDGLAAGSSIIIIGTLALFSWLSGNVIFSNYLNIMFIPRSGEITVFSGALIGGLIGFLWYNTYPAQVFMGDTGSLMLGAVIAVLAVIIRKEMLLPVLCGVFLIENFSVVLQVIYFKYTRKIYGKGKRLFLMSPLHHHYQKKGYHESKIVTRFLIIEFILSALCIISLKIQ